MLVPFWYTFKHCGRRLGFEVEKPINSDAVKQRQRSVAGAKFALYWCDKNIRVQTKHGTGEVAINICINSLVLHNSETVSMYGTCVIKMHVSE
jgi:hypothetical protein